jgi:hypothetical protein
MIIFLPTETLNVATLPSDLPEETDGKNNVVSGAMSICQNIRLDDDGVLETRTGSERLNSTVLTTTTLNHIVSQGGTRYSFTQTNIYCDETSIWP